MIHYITTNGIGNAWVGNELQRVESAGLPFRLHSLRREEGKYFESEWARRLEARTEHLYPLSPIAVAGAVIAAPFRFGTRWWQALGNALFGERESFRNRVKAIGHLAVAAVWAGRLRKDPPTHIHSQWIHSCGTVGMYGAWLLDAPFSFTGHAADLYRERVALRDKIRRADRIVCISEFHRRFYLSEGARPEQLVVVYCGIDTSHFAPPEREAEGPFTVVSSGRLVPKKGFADLIAACAVLRDRGVDLRCRIGGSGPLEGELRAQVTKLGLEDRVELTGELLPQERIPEFMAAGHVYCLPCVWAPDGDVDGLPQMLMEAMACGLPAVSTRLVGIPDLIENDVTGLLVEAGDVEALADALERLAGDRKLRTRLAEAGRSRVIETFDLDRCLEPLFQIFRGGRLRPDQASPRRAESRPLAAVGDSRS